MDKAKIREISETLAEKAQELKEKVMAWPKKTQIIAASSAGALLLLILLSCIIGGCENKNISLVRNGYLGLDKSRTVDKALSASLKGLRWRTFQSDKNYDIVEVTGTWKTNELMDAINETISVIDRGMARSSNPLLELPKYQLTVAQQLFPKKGDIILMQFQIEKDNQFFCVYGEVQTPKRVVKKVSVPYTGKIIEASTKDNFNVDAIVSHPESFVQKQKEQTTAIKAMIQ